MWVLNELAPNPSLIPSQPSFIITLLNLAFETSDELRLESLFPTLFATEELARWLGDSIAHQTNMTHNITHTTLLLLLSPQGI